MSIDLKALENLLKEKIPNAQVLLEDTMGDGQHFEAIIISDSFIDIPNITRHKTVYDILGNLVGNELHALSLKTLTVLESKNYQTNTSSHSKESTNKNVHNDSLKAIDTIIKNNDVVLFMKGNKNQPLCGFSATVVQILDKLEVNFLDINILADENLRDNIKIYSDWPTIPQLYIKGEFIGGCDITREMYQSGVLRELFKTKDIHIAQG